MNNRLNSSEDERKPSAPRRVGDLLPLLMARRGYARILAHEEFADAWRQASGPLAAQSRAGNLRRGVLDIVAANSLVLQELTFQKRQLLSSMQQLLSAQTIRDLRFSVGAIGPVDA